MLQFSTPNTKLVFERILLSMSKRYSKIFFHNILLSKSCHSNNYKYFILKGVHYCKKCTMIILLIFK